MATPHLPSGGARAVLDAIVAADPSTLDAAAIALVVASAGSTYAKPGTLLSFGPDDLRQGWISGGCLEPVLEQAAEDAIAQRRARHIILDTREDDDLLFGSRVGCRGQLQIVLLPLAVLPEIQAPLREWTQQAGALDCWSAAGNQLHLECNGHAWHWPLTWADTPPRWAFHLPAAHAVRVYGGGPESPWLLPGLRALGAYIELIERRPRWLASTAPLADHCTQAIPSAARPRLAAHYALIQHHDFELDHAALLALANEDSVRWIGLLGPAQRRDQLLHLLPAQAAQSLSARLVAPVGLALGGSGPQAIALSICAQLQQCWNTP